MSAAEILARDIARGVVKAPRPVRCIGNMERTILEGYVPMSEEEIRKRNEGRR